MIRLSKLVRATKIVPVHGIGKEIIVIGIVRDRLFGIDTIEEALKRVDTVASKDQQGMEVLAGVNKHDAHLINLSISKNTRTKGKFMSPLFAFCQNNGIPINHIGRSLTAISSELSMVSMRNPLEFYKLVWLLSTRPLSSLRSQQARQFLRKRIPSYVTSYFDVCGEFLAMNILKKLLCSEKNEIVAVIPIEHFFTVCEGLANPKLKDAERISQRINHLEEDGLGLWLPVLLLYIIIPSAFLYKSLIYLASGKITELSKFETEGLVLGTWVRDKTRD